MKRNHPLWIVEHKLWHKFPFVRKLYWFKGYWDKHKEEMWPSWVGEKTKVRKPSQEELDAWLPDSNSKFEQAIKKGGLRKKK